MLRPRSTRLAVYITALLLLSAVALWATATNYTQQFGSGHGWTYTQTACAGTCTSSDVSADGNPLPSVYAKIIGRNKSMTGYFSKAYTWEDLGVPAGDTVDTVNGQWDSKAISTIVACDATGTTVGMQVFDSANVTEITASAVEPSIWVGDDAAWTNHNPTGAVVVNDGYKASSTTIILRLNVSPYSGNNASAACEIRADNYKLSVESTAGGAPAPGGDGSFPTVAATNGGNSGVDASEHTVNLPTGISAGSLVIVLFANDGSATVTWPEGWTQLFSTDYTNRNRLSVAYRVCDGEEQSTITVTTSISEGSAHTTYRIEAYSSTPEVGTAVTGASTKPDSPSLSPTWGAADTLWLAVCGRDTGTYPRSIVSYPTDYTGGIFNIWDNTNGAGVASAQRELNAEAGDPGVFTFTSSDEWVANTIAIQPSGAPPTRSRVVVIQ